MKNHEELSYLPCEARRGRKAVTETMSQMDKDGSTSTYRKVYLCGKPGHIYGPRGDEVVLCEGHKHLAD